MPPKRLFSDRPVEDTNEDDRGIKKRRTLKSVMEGFKETLSPVTSKSLAKFNTREKRENRRGVVGLDTLVLEWDLEELVVAKDTNALNAKLDEIDTCLAIKQDVFRGYINGAREKGDLVYKHVVGTLDDLVERIEVARKQLPGMPSYWVNYHRKANC